VRSGFSAAKPSRADSNLAHGSEDDPRDGPKTYVCGHLCAQLRVAHRVPYILVTVALDRPCVLSSIDQLLAGGVADHVRMNLEGQVGLLAGPLHH
jgi:hypothetical protein